MRGTVLYRASSFVLSYTVTCLTIQKKDVGLLSGPPPATPDMQALQAVKRLLKCMYVYMYYSISSIIVLIGGTKLL